MKKVERAFGKTTALLFGKELSPLIAFESWLEHHIAKIIKVKSAVSDESVYMPTVQFYKHSQKNFVTLEESLKLGELRAQLPELETMRLSNAAQTLERIRCFSPDARVGDNTEVEESATYGYSHFIFRCSFPHTTKYAAYCFWPRESEYVFGCSMVFSSSFCINCYHSENLTRCFEVSDSQSCTDSYFCHNCENVRDSMFCFNTKGKRYAIGNVEFGREKYIQVKRLVLSDLLKALEENCEIKLSIYNVACYKRNAIG
ncbi:MAG: hypothetical protein ABIG39_02240 [Candidatus Micrarchaeota archaeon]